MGPHASTVLIGPPRAYTAAASSGSRYKCTGSSERGKEDDHEDAAWKSPTPKAATYREFLNERAILDYRAVEGKTPLRGKKGRSPALSPSDMEATRGFAGEEAAKHYPRGPGVPARVRARVVHYRVVGQARRPSSSP